MPTTILQPALPGVFPIHRGTPIRYEHADGRWTKGYAMSAPVCGEDGVWRVKIPGEGWVEISKVRMQ